MRRTAKYTWHDYKTIEDILSELKINPGVKKIQNYSNKWIQCTVNGQRWTSTLNCGASTMREMKSRTTSQKTYRLLMEPE